MNGRAFPPLAALLLLPAALGGCGRHAASPPPLAGAAIGGPFRLVDQDGRTVTDRSFAGRWRIVYFGYTYCPDVCPTTLQTLMRARAIFAAKAPARAAWLVPIFISVDPARDTPAVMKQYVAAFGPGLVGLTGSDAEITKVAREYGVDYQHEAPAPGATGYLVDHSSQAVLFGPDGAPIALLPTDLGADATAAQIAAWVR